MTTLRSRPDVVAAACGLFLFCWGLVHLDLWSGHAIVDWPTYEHYGDAILHQGLVPYRDFAVEYPPAAIATFLLPVAFGDYAAGFAWQMAACGVALVAVVAAIRVEASFYVALAPVLAGSLILSRFDLWPALLTVAALAAFLHARHRLGWGFLGAAVAAKLWPFVIVPLALVRSYRAGRARAALVGVAVAAVAFVPFALVAPQGLWRSLSGQGSRPLQIESLGASLFTTFGHPHVITTHGSQNVAGHGAVGAVFAVAQAAALVALWIAFARGPATDTRLLRYAAACVCAFVALGKVLSPQFLIWLIPLVPLVRGRRGLLATALLTAALLLTQAWFPARYFEYVDSFRNAAVVLARDLALVVLLVVLAWPDHLARRG
ncbi:MAG: glycosyltransferase 87 family protein [Gaiellaceae bacterium]